MKNNTLKIAGVIILIIIAFIIGQCTKECEVETKTVTITVPAKSGSFESPKVLVPESTTIKTVIQYKDSTLVIPQINQELVEKYMALESENDSNKRELARLKLYTDAITINTYENVFDNEDVKIIVKAKTEGKLLELKPEYTIKERTITKDIEIPKPQSKVFQLNVGVYSTYSKELKTFDPGIKLDLIGKRGSVLSVGYSVDKNIMASYSIPIFSIKK